MAGAFTVPNVEETELLLELGLEPDAFAVVLSSEDTLWLMHYKSRHDLVIHINRRVKHDSQ